MMRGAKCSALMQKIAQIACLTRNCAIELGGLKFEN